MQDWNNDNKRAAALLDSLCNDAVDSATKEEVRAWFWSGVSRDAKDAAMIGAFGRMEPNLVPDSVDYGKYAELAAMLNLDAAPRIYLHKTKKRTSPLRAYMRMAAAVMLLLGISGITYMLVNDARHSVGKQQIAEVTINSGDAVQSVTLPDGSTVELQPRSELIYADADFASLRQVHLTGEALVAVSKAVNEHGGLAPFSVVTDDIKVNVHGTVFRVMDAAGSECSTVALYEGSVCVEAGDTVTTLDPGEEYSYNNVTKESHITMIDAIEMAAHGYKPLLRFDDSTLGNLIEAISANYNVEFVLPEDADLSKGRFSGDFGTEDLANTLDILTKSNKTYSFSLTDNKVLVSRKTGRI